MLETWCLALEKAISRFDQRISGILRVGSGNSEDCMCKFSLWY